MKAPDNWQRAPEFCLEVYENFVRNCQDPSVAEDPKFQSIIRDSPRGNPRLHTSDSVYYYKQKRAIGLTDLDEL